MPDLVPRTRTAGSDSSDAVRHPPFFIVGAARSGTTMLRLMLDRHPEVAIPGESHFIPELWGRRRNYGTDGRVEDREAFVRDLSELRTFRRWDLSPDLVRKELEVLSDPIFAQAVEAVFLAHAHSRGKERWGDKTPDYVEHLPLLARLFPDALFVHLIRDGRDVALSTIDLERRHQKAATAGYFWARAVRQGMAAAAFLEPNRYREVRYESFVGDPEGQIRRLAEFLDIPFHPALLEHDRNAGQRIPEGVRRLHPNVALPPTRGLRDWRRDMRPEEIEEFEAVAGRQLLAAGYQLSGRSVGPIVRARAWGRMIPFVLDYLRRRLRRRRRRAGPTNRASS
jgi:Sulfotransferase family